MENITYSTILDRFVEKVPELEDAVLTELVELGEGDWLYMIFDLAINPYLAESLKSGMNEDVVRRIFDFVECMALDDDVRVKTVAAVSVCEYLGRSQELLQLAYPKMGPATQQLSTEIEAFWNPSKYRGDAPEP